MTFKTRTILSIAAFLSASLVSFAQYSDAPTLSTDGSSDYTTIATAINAWRTTVTSANILSYNNAIIDQVEATIKAAGKATISDSEYNTLADALYIWLNHFTDQGRAGGSYLVAWNMRDVRLNQTPDEGAAVLENTQTVWRLCRSTVPFCDGDNAGTTGNFYGIKLKGTTRLVLFASDYRYEDDQNPTSTTLGDITVCRGTGGTVSHRNIIFQTAGSAKILVFGKANHRIIFDGECDTWGAPSSYSEVLARTTPSTSRGQLLAVNGGAILASYATFQHNVTGAAGIGGLNSSGGAVVITGPTVNTCAFYKCQVKNNTSAVQHNASGTAQHAMGGGIALRDITSLPDGIYFNSCDFVGNYSEQHGGALSSYLDGNDSGVLKFKNCTFSYNASRSHTECHGGAIWHRDSGRQCIVDGCTFTGNYATGTTAGGGAISNEGHFSLSNSSFSGNMAANSLGGAIYTRFVNDGIANTPKSLSLSVDACSFTNNSCTRVPFSGEAATSSDNERGSGGAILVDLFRNSQDANSTYTADVNIINSCTFSGNSADRNGGAVAVVTTSEMAAYYPSHRSSLTSNVTLSAATFRGNTAGADRSWSSTDEHGMGGALYLSATNLSASGGSAASSFFANTATDAGGAIAIKDANIILQGGTVGGSSADGNSSGKIGGGIYMAGGTLTQNGGSITYNSAKSGGGVYISSGADYSMSAGHLSHNSATGTSTTAYNLSSADGAGGGIYLAPGSTGDPTTFTSTASSVNFYSNTAASMGNDLVAAGVNTTVAMPNVRYKLLDGEDEYGAYGWFEDYNASDGTNYVAYGSNLGDAPGRYPTKSFLVPSGTGATRYYALTLGATGNVVINKAGVATGENSIVTLHNLEGSIEDFEILLKGNGGTASKTVRFLPAGTYQVLDSTWDWDYTHGTAPGSKTVNQMQTTTFDLSATNNATAINHDEDDKTNHIGTDAPLEVLSVNETLSW